MQWIVISQLEFKLNPNPCSLIPSFIFTIQIYPRNASNTKHGHPQLLTQCLHLVCERVSVNDIRSVAGQVVRSQVKTIKKNIQQEPHYNIKLAVFYGFLWCKVFICLTMDNVINILCSTTPTLRSVVSCVTYLLCPPLPSYQ